MLKSHVKITQRNMYKEKMYALINISGLSLGIACCIILGLLLRCELTYDRHHLNHKRIFRIANELVSNGKTSSIALSPRGLGPILARDNSEIESYVRFRPILIRTLLRHEDKGFYWESGSICVADKNVFDVFTHEIIYGDPKTALSEPYSMAVSENFAKKYFGDANPIGKIVATDTTQYKITLVFADLPENTHLKYDVLLSFNRLYDEAQLLDMISDVYCYTYLLMPDGYQAESFQDIFRPFYARYIEKGFETRGLSVRAWLEPLADIHLKSDLQYDSPTGNSLNLYAFTAVAIFILLVACINYMNLATARSMKRGREVGIRKVLGATRPQLIAQFLGESIFFALIALVIGLVLVEAVTAFTPINGLLDKKELMNLFDEPVLLLWMLGLSLVVGLISGIYPAFYISSVPPISTLTGTTRSGRQGFRVRQTLVLIQFIISIAVIASTILMAVQMRYVAKKPLGFNKENQVIIRLRGADLIEKVPTLKNELLKDSRIFAVSRTYSMLEGTPMYDLSSLENNEGVMEGLQIMSFMVIGQDFIKSMEIELSSGRDFTRKLMSDTGHSVLVNETLVKKMGWEEPLGKRIKFLDTQFSVIGVVKDFHFQSLHKQIEPLIMVTVEDLFSIYYQGATPSRIILVVKISEKEISKTLDYIKEVLTEFDPRHPFEYEFLDDNLDQFYSSEWRLMKLTGIFSGICILISCLGLFGLAAFTTEQRTKEIGIRKVLGATTFQIIVMLSRGILLIVLAASVIASLVAYLAIDEWLADFAYHAGINALVFVLSAAFAMTVAFGTVALQSYRTARSNPVEALRYE